MNNFTKFLEKKQQNNLVLESEELTPDLIDLENASKVCNEEIKKIIGMDPKLSFTLNKNKIKVTSIDLSNNMKPKMFKKLYVDYFGQGVTGNTYFINLSYNYEYFDGGNNSCNIARIWLRSDGSIHKIINILEK